MLTRLALVVLFVVACAAASGMSVAPAGAGLAFGLVLLLLTHSHALQPSTGPNSARPWTRSRARRRPARKPAVTDVPDEPAGAAEAAAIEVCEALPEVEQAKLLLRFGHTDQAAGALGSLHPHPAELVDAWIKAAPAVRGSEGTGAGAPAGLCRMLNVSMTCPADADGRIPSLEDYPHVMRQIFHHWGTPACAVYLDCLLLDSRGGQRAGFPQPVAGEIVLLRRVSGSRK